MRTGLPTRKLDLFLAAKNCLFKRYRQFVAQVCPTLRTRTTRRTGGTCKESLEEIVNSTERAKIVGESCPRTYSVAQSGMPITIIGRTLLRIAQYLICLIDFDKAGFRSLLFVRIRVILLRHTTEGFLNLVIRRATRYPQHFIIISFVCGH